MTSAYPKLNRNEGFLKWGTPKSFILIECSTINHPFWGAPIQGNPQMTFSDGPSPIISGYLDGITYFITGVINDKNNW